MACSENYKPSGTLLRFSLRSRVKEYPRVAALHGIAYVADPSRSNAERFGWFVCTLASTVATLGIIFTLMERFQTDPMMNSLELRFNDAPLDLPKFYICPPWELFNHVSPPLPKYDHTFYKRLYDWDFGNLAANMTYPDDLDDTVHLRKLFERNAPTCGQFIRSATSISNRRIELNCSSFEMAVTTAGICCILPSLGRIIDETPILFSFNVTMFPIRVYTTFHGDTGLLRHLYSYFFSFPATVKTELQETYTSPEAQLLTRIQRKCFFPGEQSPYVKCVLDCRIANALKLCNCVPWYLHNDDTKECQISRYGCLISNTAKIVDTSKCYCLQSCDNIVLKNTGVEILSANESCGINIRARSLLKYKRTVRYGWSDLFVSFGGIAGLFLGCSLLSIIEFGYYFSLRAYCGAVLSSPKLKHSVIKINVVDTVHPVRLTRDREHSASSEKRITFYDYIN